MPNEITTVLNRVEKAMTQDDLLDVLYSACLTLGDNAGQQSKNEYSIADLNILIGWIDKCMSSESIINDNDVMHPILKSQRDYLQDLIIRLEILQKEDDSKNHTTILGPNFYELEKLIFSFYHLYSTVPSSMLTKLGLDPHTEIDFFSAFDQAHLIDGTQLTQDNPDVRTRKRAYFMNFACHDANKVFPSVLAIIALYNAFKEGSLLLDALAIKSHATLSELEKNAIINLYNLINDINIQQKIETYNAMPSTYIALELNQLIGKRINHDELSLALHSTNNITGIFKSNTQYQSLNYILSTRDLWSSVESIDVFLFLQGMLSKETLEMQRRSFSELTPIQTRQVLMFALADALGQTVSPRMPSYLTIRIQNVLKHLESMAHSGNNFNELPITLEIQDVDINSIIELQLRRMEGALRWVTDDDNFGLCLGIQQKAIWAQTITENPEFLTNLNTLFSGTQNMDYLPEVGLNLLKQLPQYLELKNHNQVSQQEDYIETSRQIVPNLVKALALYTLNHREDEVINFTALKLDLLAAIGSKKRGQEESIESINNRLEEYIQTMLAKESKATRGLAAEDPHGGQFSLFEAANQNVAGESTSSRPSLSSSSTL